MRKISYNGANELTSRTQSGGGGTTTYSYDGNGNLTGSTPGSSLTYNTKNQTITNGSDTYTYSGPDQGDRVQVNSATFIFSGLGLSSRTDSNGTTYFTRCSCGLLNSERATDGKVYYYLFDGLGSIVAMTDSTGAKVNYYDYDPYGVMLHQQEKSGVNNPWKFAGGYLDTTTNLYKFGVRYYDPSLGR
jgi:YD repeat-containing protein